MISLRFPWLIRAVPSEQHQLGTDRDKKENFTVGRKPCSCELWLWLASLNPHTTLQEMLLQKSICMQKHSVLMPT